MIKKDNLYFKIRNRKIGPGQPVFIVAEISANHNQDFNIAKKTIKAACLAGVDAVKIQTYTPDTLTINSKKHWFKIKADNPWKGKNLYQIYSKTYMPWKWQPELKKIAENYGVSLFSTAYDESAVNFLEKMNVPAYKIASFDLIDIELLKKIASTKKPVIISRGMSSLKELKEAIKILKENGSSDICILHCVSAYPAKPEQMNLVTISEIIKKFGVVVGLSEHSLGITASVLAVAFGASIIEKHFILDRKNGGADASFSLNPEKFKELIQSVREAEKTIGHVQFELEAKETEITLRKSLFVVRDVKKGEKFTRSNVRAIRPAYGLPPKFLPKIIGKKAKKDIERGTPLERNLIS